MSNATGGTAAAHAPATVDDSGRTLAVLSLVFGLCGFTVLPLVGSVVAVICGHLARRRLPPGSGDGYARAGLWLGWVAIAIALALVALASAVVVVRSESG